MRRSSLLPAAAILLAASSAAAQTVELPGGYAPLSGIGFGAVGGALTGVDPDHPLPVADKQEAIALVSANVPAAPAIVYGGDYLLAQSCIGYGTLALRVRGPDGATMQVLLTKTGSDGAGGTGLALGSGAVVDVTLSGTSGCNATLSRIPA